jgi:hypothetical protein
MGAATGLFEILDPKPAKPFPTKHVIDVAIDAMRAGYAGSENKYESQSSDERAYELGQRIRHDNRDGDLKMYVIHDSTTLYMTCVNEDIATIANKGFNKQVTLATAFMNPFLASLRSCDSAKIDKLEAWGVMNEFGMWENLVSYYERLHKRTGF